MTSMRTRKRRAMHSRIARLHIKCVLMLNRDSEKLEKLVAAILWPPKRQQSKDNP